MSIKNTALEKWIWVLIYGGLGLLCLGLFMQRTSPSIGWAAVGAGAAIALLGAAFIFLRSRRH